MPPTRRRLGCRPAARPAGQEPAFRADPTSERNDLPIRSVRFPIRASRTLRRLAYSGYAAGKREGERRSPSGRRIHPEAYRTLGRQNRKCGRGEIGASASPARPCGARKRGRLVRPVSGQHGSVLPSRNAGRARNICKPDYTLCYTSHSGRCFRPILSDGWKPSGMEPAGKYLHLAHSVY